MLDMACANQGLFNIEFLSIYTVANEWNMLNEKMKINTPNVFSFDPIF